MRNVKKVQEQITIKQFYFEKQCSIRTNNFHLVTFCPTKNILNLLTINLNFDTIFAHLKFYYRPAGTGPAFDLTKHRHPIRSKSCTDILPQNFHQT